MRFIVLARICIAMGVILIISGVFKLLYVLRIKKNSAFIDGEIVELIEKEYPFGPIYMKPPIMVYPVVRYTVDGVIYTEKYKAYEMQGKQTFFVGQQVSVQYNIFNCSQYLIAGEKTIREMPVFLIIFGIVMVTFFTVPLLMI